MLFNVVNEKGLADYNSAPFSKPAQRAGKYLASTGCHPSNPYPPKWPYSLLRVPRRDIFRTLINLDILLGLTVGKGECSIHTGSTRYSTQNCPLLPVYCPVSTATRQLRYVDAFSVRGNAN